MKFFTNRQTSLLIKRLHIIIVIAIILLSSCTSKNDLLVAEGRQTPTIVPSTIVEVTQTPESTLSPCDLLDKQIYYDVLQDSTLIFEFSNGSCWISNQWETKSIQVSFFQGSQAYRAIRWYTQEMVANWNQPDLISFVNQILSEGEGLGLSDFQQLAEPLYERINYRSERIFSIGDIAFWYTYPLATSNILDISLGETYVRVSINGLFPENALAASLKVASEILDKLPPTFEIDYQFGAIEAVSVASPTSVNLDIVPRIVSIQVQRSTIFFGDLCGDESTGIQISLAEPTETNNIYLVYRLTSPEETNETWVTRMMNLQTDGEWAYTLSAESDFGAFKLVDGAKIEYAFSILYAVNRVFRSPTYSDIQIKQCTLSK
ncbi:MAG: hypothetical protein BGO78_04790 [Chloroflexi bacterium 44-23]|nr:MAG: hypothetical protein BGO78_04790 [Chloroflexi bacterium 44-23]